MTKTDRSDFQSLPGRMIIRGESLNPEKDGAFLMRFCPERIMQYLNRLKDLRTELAIWTL